MTFFNNVKCAFYECCQEVGFIFVAFLMFNLKKNKTVYNLIKLALSSAKLGEIRAEIAQ